MTPFFSLSAILSRPKTCEKYIIYTKYFIIEICDNDIKLFTASLLNIFRQINSIPPYSLPFPKKKKVFGLFLNAIF